MSSGAGTELKRLFAGLGFRGDKCNRCTKFADRMDREGVQWCRDNRGLVVAWVNAQAHRRGIPCSKIIVGLLVDWAIRRAASGD